MLGFRLSSSNITVILSVSLVLFLLGSVGLLIINSDKGIDIFLEEVKLNVYLDDLDYAKKPEKTIEAHKSFVDRLDLKEYTKRTRYLSKEETLAELNDNSDIDIKELMGTSEEFMGGLIMPAIVELTLHRQFYEPAKIQSIQKDLLKDPVVTDVEVDQEVVLGVYNNIRRITLVTIIVSIFFLVISVILISNYIRLRMFSRRFLVKTMQLVGAKNIFIIKPFLIEAFWIGFIGALISLIPLLAVHYFFFMNQVFQVFDVNELWRDEKIWWLVIFIFGLGLLITSLSTIFATRRYLSMNSDELYNF